MPVSRRDFLKAAAATGVPATFDVRASEKSQRASASAYLFLNADESAFIGAAVARLIPSDANGPGAIEAGVPNYIDKQLGGAWGAGERLYRSGPWKEGTPSQGYQLPLTPAELFRNALRGVAADLQQSKSTTFDKLSPQDQDVYLTELQNGGKDLNGVPSKVFFEWLLAMTIEGYFSDPVYGGNKDMVAWRMVGFPGAYAEYYHLVDQHGLAFHREPMSLAENNQRHVHVDPNIPADGVYHDHHGN